MTPEEYGTIRDLNYIARRALNFTGAMVDALYDFNKNIPHPAFPEGYLGAYLGDANTAKMLHVMVSTDDGKWAPHRALLDKFAGELNVTIPYGPYVFPLPNPATPVVQPPPLPPPPNTVPPPPPPTNTDYAQWDTNMGPVKSFASGAAFAQEVLDIVQQNNLALMGQVGIHGKPIMNAEAALTLYHGGIIGIANSNFQNDDEQNLPAGVTPKHANYLDICNSDGGGRWMQYGFWGKMGLIRNTMNRVFTIRAMFDSRGDSCWSGDEAVVRGQMLYERADPSRREIKLSTFPPGWRISLRASSQYGAEDIDVIKEAVDKALAARGL